MCVLAIILNTICLIISLGMLGVYISIAYVTGIIIKSLEIIIYIIILVMLTRLCKKKRKEVK